MTLEIKQVWQVGERVFEQAEDAQRFLHNEMYREQLEAFIYAGTSVSPCMAEELSRFMFDNAACIREFLK